MHMHGLFEVAARSKVDGLVSWRHTFDFTCDPSLAQGRGTGQQAWAPPPVIHDRRKVVGEVVTDLLPPLYPVTAHLAVGKNLWRVVWSRD